MDSRLFGTAGAKGGKSSWRQDIGSLASLFIFSLLCLLFFLSGIRASLVVPREVEVIHSVAYSFIYLFIFNLF